MSPAHWAALKRIKARDSMGGMSAPGPEPNMRCEVCAALSFDARAYSATLCGFDQGVRGNALVSTGQTL